MKLERWALIAEMVGGIAIVVSLIFVGFQVSQNTRATQIASASNMGMALLEVNKMLAEEDLAELQVRSQSAGFSSLDAVQQERFSAVLHAYFRVLQAFYYQYRRGALESPLWDPLERNRGRILGSGNYDDWWEENKILHNREFVDYLDDEVIPAHRR